LVALLAVTGIFLAFVGLGRIPGVPGMADLLDSWTARFGNGTAMSRSAPTRISIPSLGVRANTIKVGKAADGSIATPDSDPVRDAGWYQLGPAPGEAGTAVIVGHVDSASRAAVFSKLTNLRKGKLIEVKREDRRIASFTVDSVERFPKSSFPAARVFADDRKPRLVLITCGGLWVGGPIGYADNVIVFATLN
jgi:LPXTG-site transpeptidase (sortase) family protein